MGSRIPLAVVSVMAVMFVGPGCREKSSSNGPAPADTSDTGDDATRKAWQDAGFEVVDAEEARERLPGMDTHAGFKAIGQGFITAAFDDPSPQLLTIGLMIIGDSALGSFGYVDSASGALYAFSFDLKGATCVLTGAEITGENGEKAPVGAERRREFEAALEKAIGVFR